MSDLFSLICIPRFFCWLQWDICNVVIRHPSWNIVLSLTGHTLTSITNARSAIFILQIFWLDGNNQTLTNRSLRLRFGRWHVVLIAGIWFRAQNLWLASQENEKREQESIHIRLRHMWQIQVGVVAAVMAISFLCLRRKICNAFTVFSLNCLHVFDGICLLFYV
jgi:hypothetical protein